MDAAYFNNWERSADWLPPCDEPAAIDVHGYALCIGCYEALELIGHFNGLRKREERERAHRHFLRHAMIMAALKTFLFSMLISAVIVIARLVALSH